MGFRNGKPSKQFTAIPNSLIRDYNLTDSTFRLICWVASHDENFDISFTIIEKYLGYKRDKIRNAIKNAEENDYLVRVQENNPKNGKFDWQYYIFTSKEDTKFFRENHLSIGGSSIGGSSIGGSPVDGSPIDGSSNGGSSIGGLSTVGSSTPHIDKQLEEKQLEEKHIQEAPPNKSALLTQESEFVQKQVDLTKQQRLEEPIPQQPALLLKKSESLPQTDIPSIRPTMAPGSFDKIEQSNKAKQKPVRFKSVDDLIDHLLADPGIMANEPLPSVYKNELKLRQWSFPWRTVTRDKIYQTCDKRLVELVAKERADWENVHWEKKIPTVIKSIGNMEATKGGLEQLLGYWSEILKQDKQSPQPSSPIGYYSNRAQCWHSATFCELLDRVEVVGTNRAIAEFSNRYDQQDTGATQKWLSWLETNHPKMYTHLHHQQAA